MSNEELVNMALKAMEKAYAPYSEFKVGAALLCKDGTVYTGCNIENSSYGAANCAERTAIFKAVSEGYKEFDKIAIVSCSGEFTYPCGICRQVMSEFFTEDTLIIMKDNKLGIKEMSFKDIMPHPFCIK